MAIDIRFSFKCSAEEAQDVIDTLRNDFGKLFTGYFLIFGPKIYDRSDKYDKYQLEIFEETMADCDWDFHDPIGNFAVAKNVNEKLHLMRAMVALVKAHFREGEVLAQFDGFRPYPEWYEKNDPNWK